MRRLPRGTNRSGVLKSSVKVALAALTTRMNSVLLIRRMPCLGGIAPVAGEILDQHRAGQFFEHINRFAIQGFIHGDAGQVRTGPRHEMRFDGNAEGRRIRRPIRHDLDPVHHRGEAQVPEYFAGDLLELGAFGFAGQDDAFAFKLRGDVEKETDPVRQHQVANALHTRFERFRLGVQFRADLARNFTVKGGALLFEVFEFQGGKQVGHLHSMNKSGWRCRQEPRSRPRKYETTSGHGQLLGCTPSPGVLGTRQRPSANVAP